MIKKFFLCALCVSAVILFPACSTPAPSIETQVVNVYATSAAQFWLTDLYACAEDLSVTLKIDANEPDIYLKIGEANGILSPVYQIGEEEILIVANNAIPIENISLTEAQNLFAQPNPAAQVWVFSSGGDIQRAFDRLVMQGQSVASSARVAASAEQMSARVGAESSAAGILPRHWITSHENLHVVFSAGVIPVLAITKQEPQKAVNGLIACVQAIENLLQASLLQRITQ